MDDTTSIQLALCFHHGRNNYPIIPPLFPHYAPLLPIIPSLFPIIPHYAPLIAHYPPHYSPLFPIMPPLLPIIPPLFPTIPHYSLFWQALVLWHWQAQRPHVPHSAAFLECNSVVLRPCLQRHPIRTLNIWSVINYSVTSFCHLQVANPTMLERELVSYPTSTFYSDGPLQRLSPVDPMACAAGLATFTRTWTAMDACGNRATWEQVVVIHHPPADRARSQPDAFDPAQREFTYAPGVRQGADACDPAKLVALGGQNFDPIDADHSSDACGADPWTETGCRLIPDPSFVYALAPREPFDPRVPGRMLGFPRLDYEAVLRPFPPSFKTFPADVTIDTDSPLDPAALGQPVGEAPCGTPFTIAHEDAAPVPLKCGQWLIRRTWTIQPDWVGCAGAHAQARRRVQTIIVEDRRPPAWRVPAAVPPAPIRIPFFSNYRPETSIPVAYEAAHPDMAALGLLSYPTRLISRDGRLEFPAEDPAQCREAGLARMKRTWIARDSCGNEASFEQDIIFEHPPARPATPAVQQWDPALRHFSYAPGVVQIPGPGHAVGDGCRVAKSVLGGEKEYDPLDGLAGATDNCVEGGVWSANGCREVLWNTVEVCPVLFHRTRRGGWDAPCCCGLPCFGFT